MSERCCHKTATVPSQDIEQLLVESNRRKLFAEILEDEEDAAAEKDAKLVGSIFSGGFNGTLRII